MTRPTDPTPASRPRMAHEKRRTAFTPTVVPRSLPEKALGLPELIFEDCITDNEIFDLLKSATKTGEKAS